MTQDSRFDLLAAIDQSKFRRVSTILPPFLAFQAFSGYFLRLTDGSYLAYVNGLPLWSLTEPCVPMTVDEAIKAIVLSHPDREHILRAGWDR